MRGRRFQGRAQAILFLSLWWTFWICLPEGVQASSWLLDPERFHASVHGRTSCQDCHGALRDQRLHPDPSEVGKKREDFFHVDHCLACHDDILDRLGQGVHGGRKVDAPEKYEACLSCHDPHYQLSPRDEAAKKLDPSGPGQGQCGLCHTERQVLPPLSSEDEACMACHRLPDLRHKAGVEKTKEFCLHCHGAGGTEAQRLTGRRVPLIRLDEYAATPHAGTACTVCHPGAAGFTHDRQQPGDCRQCHLPHDEKKAHDAHRRVACGACHLEGVAPLRDPVSKGVLWQRAGGPGENSRIHVMSRGDGERACRRCHTEGNPVGAAAMVLPAKSILCMPCHAATFSAGDTITILSLIVFLAGMVGLISYWLTGSMEGGTGRGPAAKLFRLFGSAVRALCSPRIRPIMKAIALDVLLQRRLYRQSKKRWLIHGLIFYPFVIRSLWGLWALFGSLWRPEWPWIWAMLDKDHPATAFLFDLTGSMLVVGLFCALLRGIRGEKSLLPGLPRPDRIALGLIGGAVLIGFLLEGMRIAMTGHPPGSEWAFLGHVISQFFLGTFHLTGGYGYVWYLHAAFTGAFIAYLPFSRLAHIVLAPVVLAMGAGEERHKGAE